MNLYKLIRQILFRFDAESMHTFSLRTLRIAQQLKLLGLDQPKAPCTVMGIHFPNPVGLAGGFDRHAQYIELLAALGFGFLEVGTITPKPQPGNSRPRIFRLPQAQALINRVGFYSKGIAYALAKLQHSTYKGILGINIGKNLTTPLEAAINDYVLGMQAFYPQASYLAINISSPNTPGLRQLQYGKFLQKFLLLLKQEQSRLADLHQRYVPLVIKIDPDLADQELIILAETLLEQKIDGVIATNTSINRQAVINLKHGNEQGGLSGAPLFPLSLKTVAKLHDSLRGKIPIIAAGGIMSAHEANQMFAAGASLLQIYSGFIYEGPSLIKQIVCNINKVKNNQIYIEGAV